jgi:PAS domain S-box-containing protein
MRAAPVRVGARRVAGGLEAYGITSRINIIKTLQYINNTYIYSHKLAYSKTPRRAARLHAGRTSRALRARDGLTAWLRRFAHARGVRMLESTDSRPRVPILRFCKWSRLTARALAWESALRMLCAMRYTAGPARLRLLANNLPVSYVNRRRAAFWATFLLPALLAPLGQARAVCLQLPFAELRTLDAEIDHNPEHAIERAEAQLKALAGHADPLREAQLLAVVAEARASQSRTDATRSTVREALARLEPLPDSADKRLVRARLVMSDVSVAWLAADLEAAITTLDGILAAAPRDTAVQSCALTRRADARGSLAQLDRAAADGITAYRIAESARLVEARIEAAFTLATIYRRSGLFSDAERMVNEVIAFGRAGERTATLSTAQYALGQILIDAGSYPEAIAALESSRQGARAIGDSFGALFTNLPLCDALIRSSQLDEAERVCSAGAADFAAAGRGDVVTRLLSHRARIDLERGRAAAALAKLNEVLGPRVKEVSATNEWQLYSDRSRAYAALGRFREAYADVERAIALERTARLTEQSRGVAVLTEASKAEQLLADNQLLAERGERQREQLASHELTRRLVTGLAVAGALASLLLGYLLLEARSHARARRAQETILRTTSGNAPDALLLLDPGRVVQFANRALFESAPQPVAGRPLADAVPGEARAAVDAALGELLEGRRPVTFEAGIGGGAERRFYELRGVPIVEDGELIGATLRSIDVTELRRLEREVIEVASRERQRFSNELHEGLGQDLAGVSLLLGSLSTAIARGAADAPALATNVGRHVMRVIDHARELARRLSPVEIERGSLSVALSRLAGDAEARLPLRVECRSTPADIRVSDVAADHLYRIAEEAIGLAARLSCCQRLELDLALEGGQLRLTASYTGGEVAEAAEAGADLGRRIIAYRARLLGGSARFESAAGGGARLLVVVSRPDLRPPFP